MAENMAYLPEVSPSSSGSYTEPRYYVYDYQGTDVAAAKNNKNYATYGVLYNWPSALAACPPGWHLPSDAEWTALSDYLGGKEVSGGKMKETGTAHWLSPNTGATNESGFSTLPGGNREPDGFFGLGFMAMFWSSSVSENTSFAWDRLLSLKDDGVSRDGHLKNNGFSVRCLCGN
jgi:uncharacterized protein (TIGR02145 family)